MHLSLEMAMVQAKGLACETRLVFNDIPY